MAAVEATDTQSVLNVNMVNVTKLTSTNYLMWSLQVHAHLDGYELAGYLDGSLPSPAATVQVNGVASPNPAFTKWRRQDRLIYSSLIEARSLQTQAIVSKAKTSADIWKTLANTYAKPSRGHMQQL